MKLSNRLVLFVKVFMVLLLIGLVLPKLIGELLDKVQIINDRIPSGNSTFVMYNNTNSKYLFHILIDLIKEVLKF
jgi:hypothetical protein